MKRSELEKHLGKQVEITIFDGDVVKGELHKTGEETFKHESDFLHPRNYYFVIDNQNKPAGRIVFSCSHVKKLTEVQNEKN